MSEVARRRSLGERVAAFGHRTAGLRLVRGAALVLALQGPVAAQQAPGELFEEAVRLQRSGDLDAAARSYQEFLERYPDSIEARSNLGVVLGALGRYAEAIQAYREALVRDPSNAAVRLNLGICYYKSRQLTEAAREFAAVRAIQPDNLQARYLEADCRLRLGEPAQTIALLEPLAAGRPDDLALAYLLGMAYLRHHRLDEGKLLIDQILRRGESAEARILLGVAKLGVKDLKGAIEDFTRAAELNPDLPSVHSLLGQTLLEAGNPDLAKAEFEKELARSPLDFEANLHYGVLLKERHEPQAALKHFETALGVKPGDVPTRYQIAALKVALRETEAALPMLEAIVEEAPEFVEARVSLATVYFRMNRRADAARQQAVIEKLNRELQQRQPSPSPHR